MGQLAPHPGDPADQYHLALRTSLLKIIAMGLENHFEKSALPVAVRTGLRNGLRHVR
jgi:hypothetical protein